MEYAKWKVLYPKRYAEDIDRHFPEMRRWEMPDDLKFDKYDDTLHVKQQAAIYILSRHPNKGPYKIGFANYNLMPRMGQYQTAFLDFYIHYVYGFADRFDAARQAEGYLHTHLLKPYRLMQPKYVPDTNTVYHDTTTITSAFDEAKNRDGEEAADEDFKQVPNTKQGLYSWSEHFDGRGMNNVRIAEAVKQMFNDPDFDVYPAFGYSFGPTRSPGIDGLGRGRKRRASRSRDAMPGYANRIYSDRPGRPRG